MALRKNPERNNLERRNLERNKPERNNPEVKKSRMWKNPETYIILPDTLRLTRITYFTVPSV